MKRREFIALLGALESPWSQAAAQTTRPLLLLVSHLPGASATFALLRAGLADFGYVDGRNIAIDEHLAKPAELATYLLARKVDVIFATGPQAVRTAVEATRNIPIVGFDLETDPVEAGYMRSFARPEGNVTGIFLDQPELAGKWLQYIKQVVPDGASIAALWDPGTGPWQRRAVEQAARQLEVKLQVIEMRPEFDTVFAEVRAERVQGLVFLSSPVVSRYAARWTALASAAGLPTISMFPEFAHAGGLLAYGPDLNALRRRAAIYVARILKGQAPGELPIDRPSTYKLMVNITTAAALNITVPALLLQTADEVIE